MDRLTELQEQKNKLAATIKEIGAQLKDDGTWESAEIQGQWDKANADYDATVAEMDKAKTAINVQNRLAAIADTGSPEPTNAGGAGLPPQSDRFGSPSNEPQQAAASREQALTSWFRNGNGREARTAGLSVTRDGMLEVPLLDGNSYNRLQEQMRSKRSKDQPTNAVFTTGTTATGGATIPAETLVTRLEMAMLYYGGIRGEAELIRTTHGETLQWPVVNDTGNAGVLLAESADAFNSGSGGPTGTFAQVSWDAYKFSSQAFVIPYELLEDTFVDLLGYVGDALGERLGRITNTYYTTGTGSSQPNGLATAAATGVTAASATAIAADEVIDLQHSVDIAYRGNAAFMMNDTTVSEIRKLKDGDSNYLWQPSYQMGVPDRLAGSRVVVNNDVADSATGNKAMLFGDFSKYKIRAVNSVRFLRLDERYADKDQVGFIAFIREDGNLLASGVDPVKAIVMA